MPVLQGQIHRHIPLATTGEWSQSVSSKQSWKRVHFSIPFLFQFVAAPTIVLSDISYEDCSDLLVEKINKSSFKCSVLYAGSWDAPGEVSFTWEAIQGE